MSFKILNFRRYLFLTFLQLIPRVILAQNTYKAHITDGHSGEVLVGANVTLKNSNFGASTDRNGNVILKNIPNGQQALEFTYIGYEEQKQILTFPIPDSNKVYNVKLDPVSLAFQTVTVTSARTNSHID